MNQTLITGAAKGFGAYLAIKLAKEGHRLVLHYNKNKEEAESIQKECLKYTDHVDIVSADFSSPQETIAFATDISKNYSINHLINNVGHYLICSALATHEQEWMELFQINLHTPFILTKYLKDSIIRQKGAIINLGVAGLGCYRADVYSSAYSITKEALLSLTRSLAKELLKDQVNVNMISPGHMENSIDSKPQSTIISFEEVSEMVIYLLGKNGKSITGQNIEIAGGVRL